MFPTTLGWNVSFTDTDDAMRLPEHPCAWGQEEGGQGGTTEESLCTLQSSAQVLLHWHFEVPHKGNVINKHHKSGFCLFSIMTFFSHKKSALPDCFFKQKCIDLKSLYFRRHLTKGL
jgi:hypothetical protein